MGNEYLKQILTQVKGSLWDGHNFRITEGKGILELDLDDALARWLIQPKGNDSAGDLKIIAVHNQQVVKALQDRGVDRGDLPDLSGWS